MHEQNIPESILLPIVEAIVRDRKKYGVLVDVTKKIRGLLPVFHSLDLSDCSFAYPGPFVDCHHLQKLNIANTNVVDEHLQMIAETNPNLQELDLSKCYWITNDGIIKLCHTVKKLISLKLNNCSRLQGHILHTIADYHHQHLTTLELAYWTYQLYSTDLIAIKRLIKLERLNLSGLMHLSNLNEVFKSSVFIRDLVLDDVALDDELIKTLIKYLKCITHLDLNGAGSISKNILMALPHQYHNIQWLGLAKQRHFDDFVCEEVFRHCVKLKGLDISHTKFTGHFFIKNVYPTLEFLNVTGCRLEGGMVEAIRNSVPNINDYRCDLSSEQKDQPQ